MKDTSAYLNRIVDPDLSGHAPDAIGIDANKSRWPEERTYRWNVNILSQGTKTDRSQGKAPSGIICRTIDCNAFQKKALIDHYDTISFGIICDIDYKDKPRTESIVDRPSYDIITMLKASDNPVVFFNPL